MTLLTRTPPRMREGVSVRRESALMAFLVLGRFVSRGVAVAGMFVRSGSGIGGRGKGEPMAKVK